MTIADRVIRVLYALIWVVPHRVEDGLMRWKPAWAQRFLMWLIFKIDPSFSDGG
jgi:hypothetical protein